MQFRIPERLSGRHRRRCGVNTNRLIDFSALTANSGVLTALALYWCVLSCLRYRLTTKFNLNAAGPTCPARLVSGGWRELEVEPGLDGGGHRRQIDTIKNRGVKNCVLGPRSNMYIPVDNLAVEI